MTTLGKYSGTYKPGPHKHPALLGIISTCQFVNTKLVEMDFPAIYDVTKDKKEIGVDLRIHYQIIDAQKAVYNVTHLAQFIKSKTVQAICMTIRENSYEEILRWGRKKLVKSLIQSFATVGEMDKDFLNSYRKYWQIQSSSHVDESGKHQTEDIFQNTCLMEDVSFQEDFPLLKKENLLLKKGKQEVKEMRTSEDNVDLSLSFSKQLDPQKFWGICIREIIIDKISPPQAVINQIVQQQEAEQTVFTAKAKINADLETAKLEAQAAKERADINRIRIQKEAETEKEKRRIEGEAIIERAKQEAMMRQTVAEAEAQAIEIKAIAEAKAAQLKAETERTIKQHDAALEFKLLEEKGKIYAASSILQELAKIEAVGEGCAKSLAENSKIIITDGSATTQLNPLFLAATTLNNFYQEKK